MDLRDSTSEREQSQDPQAHGYAIARQGAESCENEVIAQQVDLRRTERWSHYFEASLPAQFDALIHLDKTALWSPSRLPTNGDG